MNKWFQDGAPQSYKLQIGYYDIPPHLVKIKYTDTPYRFKTFEDANIIASEMFKGLNVRVVPSSDKPHLSAPIEGIKSPVSNASDSRIGPTDNTIGPITDINTERSSWFNLYGLSPSISISKPKIEQPKKTVQQKQSGQKKQSGQEKQSRQEKQSGQENQSGQKDQKGGAGGINLLKRISPNYWHRN